MHRYIIGSRSLQVRWNSSQEIGRIYNTLNLLKTSNHTEIVSNTCLNVFIQERLFKIEKIHDLKLVKNKMMRTFTSGYGPIMRLYCSQLSTMQKVLCLMIFYRHSGKIQYEAFVNALIYIMNSTLSTEDKKQRLYYVIKMQRELYSELAKQSGVLIPDEIHKWFYYNIPRSEFFNHYYYLIQNNVLVQSKFSLKFMDALLNGSEMEFQLATFQIFLHDPANKYIFDQQFTKMYNFASIKKIVTFTCNKKDFRFIQDYFLALTSRLEQKELSNVGISKETKKLSLIQFTHILLHFARTSNNVPLFLETFKSLTEFYSRSIPFSLFQKSLIEILNFLKLNGQHHHVFKVISLWNKVSLKRTNNNVTKRILGEIISTLRSFKDPKLSASYVITAYKSSKTKYIFNDLGLWSLIFHDSFSIIDKQLLLNDAEKSVLKVDVPERLKFKRVPDSVILCEIYQVVLEYQASKLSKEKFHELILDLYYRYKDVMLKKANTYFYWRFDVSILRVLVHQSRFTLKDGKLAYMILNDFYSSGLKLKCSQRSNPFGIALYKNNSLTHTEVNQALILMAKCNIPLDSFTMISLILRYLSTDNIKEAYSWYQRFYKSGFEVKHYELIQAIKKYGWEFPKSFDPKLLDKPPDKYVKFPDSITEDIFDDFFDDTRYADKLITLIKKMTSKYEC